MEKRGTSRASAILIVSVFVAAAFVGVVSVASSTARALTATDLLKAFDASAIAGSDEGLLSNPNLFGAHPNQPVAVILKLPGDPVAVVEGNLGVKLSAAQKEAIKADLRARQDAVKPIITSLGGTVLDQYQVVYNGIAVQIPAARVWALARVTDAISVSPVSLWQPDNTVGIPLIGAPSVWSSVPGFRGEGVKIGIIDTGIDYTHANFGGPGTPGAYAAAHATETAPANPAYFGPGAPKVKGGIDLVGDAFTGYNTPHSDPNPLDCNGHGSHVSGTAAGFGVLSSGSTYTGPYDPSIYETNSFEIGPGVAPLADLYAIRVFGCSGVTPDAIIVEALEWAVDHDLDVINMSLGSPFGLAGDASSEAADNAAKAGVVVVASAGNGGSNPYITGSPAAADRAISVAASDPTPTFPGATVTLTSGSIVAQNSNNEALPSGPLTVAVLRTSYPSGPVSLGCSPADYTSFPGGVTGKLVVTVRGTCARVARAIYGQQAGAAAVAMINTDSGYPPFEGAITSNPDTGIPYTVTIPFLGVRGVLSSGTSDGSKLVAADGTSASLTATTIVNPGFKAFASFTSGGPRSGDSVLKPDITAPGVSTMSTAMGTGNKGERLSGTSMASPHVTGVAALVREAHPSWSVADVKAAIVDTGSPSDVTGYLTRRGGTGLVQAFPAAMTSVVAWGDRSLVSLSFGFSELSTDYVREAELHVRDTGTSPATFTLSWALTPGSRPAALVLERTKVTVRPGQTKEIEVTLTVPAATVGDSSAFRNVAGIITLTPVGNSNGGIALRVPFYMVPRASSNVKAEFDGELSPSNPTGTVTLTNPHGVLAGGADFYAWGLKDRDLGLGSHDMRAVGVQAFQWDATRQLVVFAINTYQRWSNPSVNEFDILLDTNGDGIADYIVLGIDYGLMTAGSYNGRMGAFAWNLVTNKIYIDFFATAPTDGSTIELPVLSNRIGLSASKPRFAYSAVSFSAYGLPTDVMPGTASFNAFTPAISNGDFVTVAPGATTTSTVSIDPTEWATTPALGVMIVVLDNHSGSAEARLLPVEFEAEEAGG